MAIKEINVGMTYNAVHATDAQCTSLKFLVLQTGTNVRLCPMFTRWISNLANERLLAEFVALRGCCIPTHGQDPNQSPIGGTYPTDPLPLRR